MKLSKDLYRLPSISLSLFFQALCIFHLQNSGQSLGLINPKGTKRLSFIVEAAYELLPLVTSPRRMVIRSRSSLIASQPLFFLVVHYSLFNYKGSWLEWVQKEGNGRASS
jgi:hypothetical protein